MFVCIINHLIRSLPILALWGWFIPLLFCLFLIVNGTSIEWSISKSVQQRKMAHLWWQWGLLLEGGIMASTHFEMEIRFLVVLVSWAGQPWNWLYWACLESSFRPRQGCKCVHYYVFVYYKNAVMKAFFGSRRKSDLDCWYSYKISRSEFRSLYMPWPKVQI